MRSRSNYTIFCMMEHIRSYVQGSLTRVINFFFFFNYETSGWLCANTCNIPNQRICVIAPKRPLSRLTLIQISSISATSTKNALLAFSLTLQYLLMAKIHPSNYRNYNATFMIVTIARQYRKMLNIATHIRSSQILIDRCHETSVCYNSICPVPCEIRDSRHRRSDKLTIGNLLHRVCAWLIEKFWVEVRKICLFC